MIRYRAHALALLALWGLAFLLTGSVWGIFYPLVFHDHLHPFLWGALAVGAVAAAYPAKRLTALVPRVWRPAAAVLLIAGGGIAGLVLAGDLQRSLGMARFGADLSTEQSLLRSLRTAPRAFQFTLHAAMLKDCVAHGWSYRTLAPYEIPEGARANVLPRGWIAPGTRCGPPAK